ncbi:1,4-dihydroxy-2-naphthoate polyprenyltransferase [Bacillus sp. B1-b2]|uniref:1,4-dihydroxy-2-naphthoate polyprenyltransferase n=1 Tax=Bacillus sp. B1-b2 TaxID=2653201 RepID=UPI0012621205|nr:1,4-dihydroxy-2-naphthoate polyprenyltransferase [Bacillus sp. B1-b2]KAB7669967.1 1,4-dihydroxy-2-naphthoate polyprenyltransferase [Bacillus sp. B1-b2]
MDNVTTNNDQPTHKILWKLTRPHTLTASFVPVSIGTVLAVPLTSIHWGLFFAMMFACLIIQIATNLFNEYYDFVRGIDTADSVGIGGAIVNHGMKPKTVLTMALTLYLIALILGVYICSSTSWWIALVGLVGMAIGYLYTGGPLPIAYTPFGEIFSGVCMGCIFILISFFIQTGTLSQESILISIPVSVLIGAINLSNNIRDIEEDTLGGRKTIAILMGYDKAVQFLAGLFIFSYLWVIVFVAFGIFTPWLLIVVLSFNKPLQAIKGFKGGKSQTPIAMKNTGMTNTFFGLFITIGYLLSFLMERF